MLNKKNYYLIVNNSYDVLLKKIKMLGYINKLLLQIVIYLNKISILFLF